MIGEKSTNEASAPASGISRRRLMQLSAGALGALGTVSLGTRDPMAAQAEDTTLVPQNVALSLRVASERAYAFLDTMMDAYAQGSSLRLAQSYADQLGLNSTAFIYDNALTIIAYLRRSTQTSRRRAILLGESLIYAQDHDPTYQDGRLRDSYFVSPSFVTNGGSVQLDGPPAFLNATAVGNLAWAGLALVRLYDNTHTQHYLTAALKLGNWIVLNAYDTRGAGGYTLGVDGGNARLLAKSTEHNIDVYAFFRLLAQFTGDQTYPGLNQPWSALAAHALALVTAMWNGTGHYFATGTNADGVTINPSPIPEDVQTWSYLALKDPTFAASVDWARTNLASTDTPQAYNSTLAANLTFRGVTFSSVSRHPASLQPPNNFTPAPDPDGVWFEGTAHLVDALLTRNQPGNLSSALPSDSQVAVDCLSNLLAAQAQLGQNQTVGGQPLVTGNGLVAASSPLDTGFGFDYFPYLHIGATAWFLIAAAHLNPFRLDPTDLLP